MADLTPAPQSTLSIERLPSDDGTATIVCRGRITVENSGAFKSEVKNLAPTHEHILADLSEVNFVDSFGLGDVLAAYIAARAVGCNLMLINVHPRVKDLLNITRLASVLEEGVVSPAIPKATNA
jgi:anti-sigma B factor antagonist